MKEPISAASPSNAVGPLFRARIGFSTAKGFLGLVSSLIRRVAGGEASHVWFVYYDPVLLCEIVLEAHLTEVRAISLAAFKRENNVKAIVDPHVPIEAGLPVAAGMLGVGYDYLGLFGMTWVLLGRRFKARWRNPFRSARAQFCAEMVVRVLHEVRHPGVADLDPEGTSPEDLWRLFKAQATLPKKEG